MFFSLAWPCVERLVGQCPASGPLQSDDMVTGRFCQQWAVCCHHLPVPVQGCWLAKHLVQVDVAVAQNLLRCRRVMVLQHPLTLPAVAGGQCPVGKWHLAPIPVGHQGCHRGEGGVLSQKDGLKEGQQAIVAAGPPAPLSHQASGATEVLKHCPSGHSCLVGPPAPPQRGIPALGGAVAVVSFQKGAPAKVEVRGSTWVTA